MAPGLAKLVNLHVVEGAMGIRSRNLDHSRQFEAKQSKNGSADYYGSTLLLPKMRHFLGVFPCTVN